MSVLIATGVLAAYVFSVVITIGDLGETFYEAAAMLVTFVLFGHWMEMKARRGTTDSLRALFDLVPPTATVVRNGQDVEVPTTEIAVGEIIRLRPGGKVAVDGVIESGETSIDESLVTGESLPVDKTVSDEVIGGSINPLRNDHLPRNEDRRRHGPRPDRAPGRRSAEIEGAGSAARRQGGAVSGHPRRGFGDRDLSRLAVRALARRPCSR
jgi:magnesium-transporting ATPase (P-type)